MKHIKLFEQFVNEGYYSSSDIKKLKEFAEKYQIPIAKDKRGEAPFSTDANLLHTSSEGKILEDPWEKAPEYVYSRTKSPFDAPNTITEIEIMRYIVLIQATFVIVFTA